MWSQIIVILDGSRSFITPFEGVLKGVVLHCNNIFLSKQIFDAYIYKFYVASSFLFDSGMWIANSMSCKSSRPFEGFSINTIASAINKNRIMILGFASSYDHRDVTPSQLNDIFPHSGLIGSRNNSDYTTELRRFPRPEKISHSARDCLNSN